VSSHLPLPASACAESILLSASHTRAHSWLGLRKSFLAPPARDRLCSVLCTLAPAPVLSFASSGMCLLREIPPAWDRFACASCVRLFRAFAPGLPIRGSSVCLGRGLPLGGFSTPYGPTVWGIRPWTPSQRELRLSGPWSPPRGLLHPPTVQPFGAFAPGLPLRRSSVFLGRGLPLRGFSTPAVQPSLGRGQPCVSLMSAFVRGFRPLDSLSEGVPRVSHKRARSGPPPLNSLPLRGHRADQFLAANNFSSLHPWLCLGCDDSCSNSFQQLRGSMSLAAPLALPRLRQC
jgi:hypothetical protein